MENKNVVIYARVSSREQEKEGFSIPAQLKLLREYAGRNGFNIVEEYSDAETAKKAGRTNYNKMLNFLKENPTIRTVLVEKTDRLYRNFKDYVTLEDYDLEVHLVKEGSIISKNSKSHDKFIHGIKVLMAKNYIDNLSEEISKGLHEGLEQGYWPFQPPYGYKRGAKKALCFDNKNVLFVKRAFELFSTGRYSIRKLAEKLYLEGYYYRPDRPKITHCVLESMLKNVIYIGMMNCNGVLYQGKHPAMITRELFDKTQDAFRKAGKSRVRKHFDFLYPGMAKCGECGYAFCGELHKGNVYYRCSHTDRTCCNTSYLSEKEFTSALRRHLRRIAVDKNIYELLKISIKESLTDEENFHKTEVERISKEMEDAKAFLKKIYIDQVNKVLDYNLWVSLKNEYELKLSNLTSELGKHNFSRTNYMDLGVKILDSCLKASYGVNELSAEEVAQLARLTMTDITILNKRVKIQFVKPFDTIEKLIRLAKIGIEEMGYDEFTNYILSHKDECIQTIKKSPEGSNLVDTTCIKWWRLGDSNS